MTDKYEFSNGKTSIHCKTVGDLIRELSLLESELPLDQDYDGHGCDVVCMNVDCSWSSPFVQFSKGGEWDEDVVFEDEEDD